jgi:hypothetical protein
MSSNLDITSTCNWDDVRQIRHGRFFGILSEHFEDVDDPVERFKEAYDDNSKFDSVPNNFVMLMRRVCISPTVGRSDGSREKYKKRCTFV